MRIEDVHAIRMKRAQVNHDTYKALFEQCCERIRRRALLPNAPQSMTYQVPPFQWGRPPYKHTHATRYVTEKLRRNGFHVTDQGQGLLCVDWGCPKKAPRPAGALKTAKTAKAAKTAKTVKTVTFSEPPTGKLSDRLAALRTQLTR